VILEALRALRERSDAGEDIRPPRVTLHLASGRDVSGWVVDSNESAVLLQPAEGRPAAPGPDTLYVEMAALEAVTVHDSDSVSSALRFESEHGRRPASPSPGESD
jgi:hypothetical protein